MTITETELSAALHRIASTFEVRDPHGESLVDTARARSPRNRRRRSVIGLAATAVVAIGAGAAAALTRDLPRAATYKAEMRSDAQEAAVADGRVTFAEYADGFARWQACAAASGHPLRDVRLDPTTNLYDATIDDVPETDDCYQREFYALDVTWQTDPARPGFNPVSSLDIYNACAGDQQSLDFIAKYNVQLRPKLCEQVLKNGPPESAKGHALGN